MGADGCPWWTGQQGHPQKGWTCQQFDEWNWSWLGDFHQRFGVLTHSHMISDEWSLPRPSWLMVVMLWHGQSPLVVNYGMVCPLVGQADGRSFMFIGSKNGGIFVARLRRPEVNHSTHGFPVGNVCICMFWLEILPREHSKSPASNNSTVVTEKESWIFSAGNLDHW